MQNHVQTRFSQDVSQVLNQILSNAYEELKNVVQCRNIFIVIGKIVLRDFVELKLASFGRALNEFQRILANPVTSFALNFMNIVTQMSPDAKLDAKIKVLLAQTLRDLIHKIITDCLTIVLEKMDLGVTLLTRDVKFDVNDVVCIECGVGHCGDEVSLSIRKVGSLDVILKMFFEFVNRELEQI